MTIDEITIELRERYPDPEDRWIAAHRLYKHEDVTSEDYHTMRAGYARELETWQRLERIGK